MTVTKSFKLNQLLKLLRTAVQVLILLGFR